MCTTDSGQAGVDPRTVPAGRGGHPPRPPLGQNLPLVGEVR
jgi:hypothetical protein